MPKGRKGGNPSIAEAGEKTRFTSETAVINGKKGNSANGELKKFREYLTDNLGKKGKNGATFYEGIAKALINKGLTGDPNAVKLVLGVMGEMPKENVEISVSKIDTAKLDELESVVLNDTRQGDTATS